MQADLQFPLLFAHKEYYWANSISSQVSNLDGVVLEIYYGQKQPTEVSYKKKVFLKILQHS